MEKQDYKLIILNTDVTCEFKTIKSKINTSLFFHNHDGYELLLILNGEIDLYWEGSSQRLAHGDLMCIAPYVFHGATLRTPDCYDRICISIKEPFLPLLSSDETNLMPLFSGKIKGEPNLQHLSEGEIEELLSLSGALERALKKQVWGDDLLATALLTQILLLVGRHRDRKNTKKQTVNIMPELISQTFSYINDHLTEKICLDSLASFIHHDPSYIGRCFKKITGTTINQYIILKRITLAQQYLREGYPPNEVCYMSGFQNYSHFSRTFRTHARISPRQYQTQFMTRHYPLL